MNTPTQQELQRLRDIAERGHGAPLLGGWHLILWGSALSLALVFHWAVATRLLPWPGYSLAISWFGIVAVAWGISVVIGRRLGCRSGASAAANRVERAVWVTAGGFLTLFAAAIFARASLEDSAAAWQLFAVMPPVSFGAYAIAVGATAAVTDSSAHRPFAWVALLLAAATTALIGEAAQYLVAAAGILLVSVPPAMVQLRAERLAS